MSLKASCCCKQLSIEIEGEPAFQAICHCSNCKARTGSAFGYSVYFTNEQVKEVAGEKSDYLINTENKQSRHFCPTCGTTLYWYVEKIPGMVGVAGGCFPIGVLSEPQYSSSSEGQCSWVALPESMQKV